MDTGKAESLAGQALKYTKLRLLQKLPHLAGALVIPEEGWSRADADMSGAHFGMSGERFLWNPSAVCVWYGQEPAQLERRYLHLLMHGLYLHPFQNFCGSRRIRNLACDICTEYRIDCMDVPGFGRPVGGERSRVYRKIKEAGILFSEGSMARWLARQEEATVREMERIFRKDSHELWESSPAKDDEQTPLRRERVQAERLLMKAGAAHRWRTAFEQAEFRKREHKRQAGGSAGEGVQEIILEKEGGYDYRSFLKQFMQEREEMYLDTDSFDYIPYDYSRRMYGRLLFIEPLEYKEMRKLEEFVIAIDTSGSCAGEVVRHFLEEVWEIFCEEENFFRKVNIHLIQCDCLIQEHVRITCEKDWKDYLNHMEVKGHGDTDFTPVFRLVEELRKSGELKNLKGLLYFTDGDGIYPEEKPDYETAFVFLNESLTKGRAPDWALSLTLERGPETGV